MRLSALLLIAGLLTLAVSCGESGPEEVDPGPRPTESAELRELRAEHEKTRAELETLRSEMEEFRAAAESDAKLERVLEALLERRLPPNRFIDGGSLPRAVPHVRARVTRADVDRNVVTIAIECGGRDLAVGDVITVYRGDVYVGKLVIDEKKGDTASGHMDRDLTTTFPETGDRVLAWR